MYPRRQKREGGPVKIHALFEVYKKRLRAPEASVTDAAIEVIKDLTGIALTKTHLSYSPHTRILTIKAPGPQKTEIILMGGDILTHLKGRLGPHSAPTRIL